MITVKSNDLWVELEKLAKKATCINAAVAYVSDDSCIAFGKGDLLVVDASDESIAGGRTSATLLDKAYQLGAKLYSCDTLHGKVIVFDDHAYIGSANVSINSRKSLDEIGVISDHPNIISGAIHFIDELVHQSTEIDKKFIELILKIDVNRDTSHNKKSRKICIIKPRAWLVSLRNDATFPGDEDRVNEDNEKIETAEHENAAWFFMKKGSSFYNEAKLGDSIILIGREKNASKKPEYAYRHVIIKYITVDTDAETKVYHYAHTDDYAIDWDLFLELADKVGVKRLGSGLNTARELPVKQSNALFELWPS